MMDYKKSFLFFVLLSAVFGFTSCAIVTININFPAQEVREAYEDLEDEFLDDPMDEANEPEARKGSEEQLKDVYTEQAVSSTTTIKVRRVFFLQKFLQTSFTDMAWAGSDISTSIAAEIRKMPEVIEAYGGRKARKTTINGMLASKVAGEGKNGLLVQRGDISSAQVRALNDENKDRQTIMTGMARAILKLNNITPTSGKVREVYPQAAEQFAATRISKAKPGWLIQLSNGVWRNK